MVKIAYFSNTWVLLQNYFEHIYIVFRALNHYSINTWNCGGQHSIYNKYR